MLDKRFNDRAHSDDERTDRQDSQQQSKEENQSNLGEATSPDEETESGSEPDSQEQISPDDDTLVEGAVSELKRIEGGLSLAEGDRQKRLSVFVARAYMVSMAGKRDNGRHEALCLKSGIKVRRNTPHNKQTLKAILKLAGVTLVRQTEHECCLVLDGLEISGVEAEERAVMKFFDNTAEIEGRYVSGFSRAKAARTASQQLKDDRQARRSQIAVEQDDALQAVVAKGERNRLGAIEVAEDDRELESGLWLSINQGHYVLFNLKVTPEQLRSIVVKHTVRE